MYYKKWIRLLSMRKLVGDELHRYYFDIVFVIISCTNVSMCNNKQCIKSIIISRYYLKGSVSQDLKKHLKVFDVKCVFSWNSDGLYIFFIAWFFFSFKNKVLIFNLANPFINFRLFPKPYCQLFKRSLNSRFRSLSGYSIGFQPVSNNLL